MGALDHDPGDVQADGGMGFNFGMMLCGTISVMSEVLITDPEAMKADKYHLADGLDYLVAGLAFDLETER
jgi:hypothetical protein